jgi:hypothetical protein
MMAHPMHLHGHAFQVVALNGAPLAGAMHDTVLVPPMGSAQRSVAHAREDSELPRAAIFDVDGSLLDSVDLHALAWHEAMVMFGHDVGFEQVRG